MNALINGKIIYDGSILEGKALIFNDRIEQIVPVADIGRHNVENIFDAKGLYVSAGFIDIHTHGAAGCDVMDGEPNAIAMICESKARQGVTGYLPTTMTMEYDAIYKALDNLLAAQKAKTGIKILGCHLEGPFISPSKAGAQDAANIKKPNFKAIKGYKEIIKIITVAPELDGADKFIKECVKNNIIVSVGHSGANYQDAVHAFGEGAQSVTHTFNAMPPLHHREPGIIGAALENELVYCELIADNIHVHPSIQRMLLKAKGIDKVILVTDSMSACAMEDGVYSLGGQKVIVKDKSARLENGRLAGSVLTMNTALNNFKQNTGVSFADAVKTVTENPARLLDIYSKTGSLDCGKAADIAVFDEDFNVKYTFADGELAYTSI